jgi:hypothetical protein
MSVSVAAVWGEITCRTASGSIRRAGWPLASRNARTTCGCMRRPPFAIAPNAARSWTPVTETSCPIEIAASERPDQRLGFRSCPRLSPGSPIPVSPPKPNSVMWRW